ncbi:MAG: DUF5802 family protein [Halobacteriales archaeon]|nr:DUF5802 family protein [Halobacteriales archaeon]
MFDDFSSGYYLGRMYVEPYDAEHPVMQDSDFEAVSNGVYDEEKPLVMKVEQHHLVVDGDDGVPTGTLGVPEKVADELRLRNPPSVKDVLLAKEDHATRILSLKGFEDGVS